jgi:prepilin peptidase CpaA
MTHVICTALLLAGVAIAAANDIARRKISNRLVVPIGLVAIAAALLERGPIALVVAVALICAVLAFGTVAFSLRILGGGDVKLIAALAASLAPGDVVLFVLFTAAGGAVVAAAYAALKGRLGSVVTSVSRSASATVQLRRRVAPATSGLRVPYALAIGVGFIMTVSLHSGMLIPGVVR